MDEAMVFELQNSLGEGGRGPVPFVAGDPSRVTIYTCGPTVYDDAHVGNFRAFMIADVARRWLESPLCAIHDLSGGVHAGPRTAVHVMNITDVGHMTEDAVADGGGEDKMALAGGRVLEAKKCGAVPADADVDPRDPFSVARFYERRFMEDARRLGVKVALEAQDDPTLVPRATDAVPDMIRVVRALEDRGYAYAVGEPGSRVVYFDVQKFEAYGTLSGNTIDAVRAGAGGRVAGSSISQKRHPADFLLWKEDAAHLMKWDSPWGMGYPGWHIECTAMSVARLGDPSGAGGTGGLEPYLSGLIGKGSTAAGPVIDLHTGGEDNKFPHHECESAQTCALTGSDSAARQWLHAAFLTLNGEKISKSRGNSVTPRELFERGVEPAAVRLELIGSHYRTNADFVEANLDAKARVVARWRRFAEAAEKGSAEEHPATGEARGEFARCLSADLNMAGAIAAVERWVKAVASPGPAEAACMRTFDGVLGVLDLERPEQTATAVGVFIGVEPDAGVERLLCERAEARKGKDFARADAIRDELAGRGLAIKDAAGGTVEVTRA